MSFCLTVGHKRYEIRPRKAHPKHTIGIRTSDDAQEKAAKINEFNNLLFIMMPSW
jgi:hypothetical protein